MLRIPHCLDNRLTDGGKVVSLTHPSDYTLQKHYYLKNETLFFVHVFDCFIIINRVHLQAYVQLQTPSLSKICEKIVVLPVS
jgi:hypothetical protein